MVAKFQNRTRAYDTTSSTEPGHMTPLRPHYAYPRASSCEAKYCHSISKNPPEGPAAFGLRRTLLPRLTTSAPPKIFSTISQSRLLYPIRSLWRAGAHWSLNKLQLSRNSRAKENNQRESIDVTLRVEQTKKMYLNAKQKSCTVTENPIDF